VQPFTTDKTLIHEAVKKIRRSATTSFRDDMDRSMLDDPIYQRSGLSIPASFESRVHLDDGTARKFSISYGGDKTSATLQSEPLPIPAQTTPMEVRVDAGVAARKGGKPTTEALVKTVDIPGLYGLAVSEITTDVVSNDNGVLKFEFLDGTNLKEGEGHMGGLEISVNGEQLTEKWSYIKDGKVVGETPFEFTKKS